MSDTPIVSNRELSENSKDCKNCGTPHDGNFCPECGQKHITRRLTLREGFGNLIGSFINFDRGLWHTTIWMFKKPGQVIRDYLSGRTVPYMNPFRFMFIWLTIQVILMAITGMTAETQARVAEAMHQEMNPAQVMINTAMQKYMHLFLAGTIPFMSLASKWFFGKFKLHFAEHLAMNCFQYGAAVVLGFLSIIVYMIAPQFVVYSSAILFGINLIYLTYTYRAMFKQNVVLIFFKVIGIQAVWYLGLMLIIALIFTPIVIYQIAQNPEMLEQFKNAAPQ